MVANDKLIYGEGVEWYVDRRCMLISDQSGRTIGMTIGKKVITLEEALKLKTPLYVLK